MRRAAAHAWRRMSMTQLRSGTLLLLLAGLLGTGTVLVSQQAPSPNGTDPAQKDPREKSLASIQVPPGFVVERVAGPPLIERPMMASFDERGRLFVCDSSGFNLLKGSSDILLQDPPHCIRLLEDTRGAGRFDKSTLFADKMTFPMGALW